MESGELRLADPVWPKLVSAEPSLSVSLGPSKSDHLQYLTESTTITTTIMMMIMISDDKPCQENDAERATTIDSARHVLPYLASLRTGWYLQGGIDSSSPIVPDYFFCSLHMARRPRYLIIYPHVLWYLYPSIHSSMCYNLVHNVKNRSLS